MSRLVASALMWLALVAVVLVAGGHTIYYLLRWEWARADMAGTAFVAALIAGSTLLLLGRMRRIERRLDQLSRVHTEETRGEPVSPEPRPDFPWLATSDPLLVVPALLVALPEPRGAVFIPVLLAAGVLFSVLAGAVERLAALRHHGEPATPEEDPREVLQQMVRARPGRLLLGVPLAGVLVIGLVVGGLYWATHYWGRSLGPGTTTITVVVEHTGPTQPDADVVEAVGRYCTLNTGTGVRFQEVAPGPDGATLLRVSPRLDEDARSRFTGCLEDSVVEWHRLTVTDTVLDTR